ncbi:MAG TPA: hypothetical protein VGF45_05355 [Polyangia bacterium]
MKDEVIDHVIKCEVDNLPLDKEVRQTAEHMGRAYLANDCDWLLKALIDSTGFSAEGKAELRRFHERIRKTKAGHGPVAFDGALKVQLTKAEEPSSSLFRQILANGLTTDARRGARETKHLLGK